MSAVSATEMTGQVLPSSSRSYGGVIRFGLGMMFLINSALIAWLAQVHIDGWKDWADDGHILAAVSALIGIVCFILHLLKMSWNVQGSSRYLRFLVLASVMAALVWAAMAPKPLLALHSAGWVTFFLLLTVMLESHNAIGAQRTLEELIDLTPGMARRVNADGTLQEVNPEMLNPGDMIELQPGDMIYADGEIVEGCSAVDEAKVTGESVPADKGPGDIVYAGSINLNGKLRVRVDKVGKQTTIGQVKELIHQARSAKLPTVGIVEHLLRHYVPVIFMLAVIIWFASGYDLRKTVVFLVASCPAAVILAAPSAALAFLSTAARSGLLLKKVSDIELLAEIDRIILDKTGTLTQGSPTVTALVPLEGVSNVELLKCAASVEQDSTHPIARAVTELAKQANLPLVRTSELRETPGRGVAARLDDDLVLLGNKLWMEENGLDLSRLDLTKASDTATLLFVARNRNILGWIEVEDTLRPDAGEMVRRLRDHGISSLAMVSGDREKVCRKIGQQLELDHIYGECIPQQKVELVRQAKQEGRVLFVGDGVNDGPALAESDIAIAMGGIGSDLALETASIVLLNNRLTRIPFILKVSRLSRWIIIQNLIAGAFVVVFGIILALTIELQPWVAALLQLGGALFPLFNSARLLKYYDTDQQISIPPVGDEAE